MFYSFHLIIIKSVFKGQLWPLQIKVIRDLNLINQFIKFIFMFQHYQFFPVIEFIPTYHQIFISMLAKRGYFRYNDFVILQGHKFQFQFLEYHPYQHLFVLPLHQISKQHLKFWNGVKVIILKNYLIEITLWCNILLLNQLFQFFILLSEILDNLSIITYMLFCI